MRVSVLQRKRTTMNAQETNRQTEYNTKGSSLTPFPSSSLDLRNLDVTSMSKKIDRQACVEFRRKIRIRAVTWILIAVICLQFQVRNSARAADFTPDEI